VIKSYAVSKFALIGPSIRGGLEWRMILAPTYELTQDEVPQFANFWRKFAAVKRWPSLDIAIRRFNTAYERGRLDDKLLDYMIAFEALFFRKDERGELRNRLAVRAARFLRKRFDERRVLLKRFLELYDERSRVVHGDPGAVPPALVTEAETHLRDSIKKFLEIGSQDHEETLYHLDLE
jgi:hypothetical protein